MLRIPPPVSTLRPVFSAMARMISWFGYAILALFIVLLITNCFNGCLFSFDAAGNYMPEFTIDESQLTYMSNWLDDRFAYLDREINAGCGTWGIEAPEPVEGPTQIVEIYPNPAKDCVNVRFAEIGEATIRLYDMTGRLVYSHASNTQAVVIPTQGLSQGIYTLVVNVAGKQQIDRVVVE